MQVRFIQDMRLSRRGTGQLQQLFSHALQHNEQQLLPRTATRSCRQQRREIRLGGRQNAV